MPRLTMRPPTFNKNKIEASQRNGLRNAIFSPNAGRLYKEYYKGDWKNDKKEGKGVRLNRDGWLYEGDLVNNKRHGYGVLSKVAENGSIRKTYAGDWVAGKRNGTGSNWYLGGSYYEGDFRENKRHGYGRIWYKDRGFYQGTWKNDFYDGPGMLVQPDGNRYEGNFEKGKKEGYGIFYHLHSGQVHPGFWKNNSCVSGIMEDTHWRQSALRATSYPIPKIELSNWPDIFNSTQNMRSPRDIEIAREFKPCKMRFHVCRYIKEYQ